jgi:hypothetical protein
MQIKSSTCALLLTLAWFTPLRSAHAQTLAGAIDIHAHSDPDGTPRSIDAIDLAKLAKSRGMRAIVLKNHHEPTASLAYIVRKEVPVRYSAASHSISPMAASIPRRSNDDW